MKVICRNVSLGMKYLNRFEREHSLLLNGIIVFWAFATISLLIGLCFFTTFHVSGDDLTLFNPIYMDLHTGKLTYPVHFDFAQTMTVHPPVHYMLISFFMKMGIGAYHAIRSPMVLACLLALFLILRSSINGMLKLAFIFGIHAIIMAGMPSIRPDATLSLIWLSGLVCLEDGRLSGWKKRKLFWGGFLLCYASGLHYFAVVAVLGVLVYMQQAWRELGFKQAKPAIISMAAGACLFGIPYLVFFIIPNFPRIMDYIGYNQGEGGITEALARHKLIAGYIHNMLNVDNFTLLPILLKPTNHQIPLILIALPALLLIKPTRLFALTASPLPLFILLYSRNKSQGYFIPEFMLYEILICFILLYLFARLAHRLPRFVNIVPFVFASLVLMYSFTAVSEAVMRMDPITTDKHIFEADLARACSKEIIGDNALVGGRLSIWYTGGTAYWHDIGPDLLWNFDMDTISLCQYLQAYDAIADHAHMSKMGDSEQGHTLTDFYLDDRLYMNGFYLSYNDLDIPLFLFKTEQTDTLQGFVHTKNGDFYRFEEAVNGPFVFVTYRTSSDETYLRINNNSVIAKAFFLSHDQTKPDLGWMLMHTDTLNRRLKTFGNDMKIKDRIAGKLIPEDKYKLLEKLKKTDKLIKFYSTQAEAIEGKRQVEKPVR